MKKHGSPLRKRTNNNKQTGKAKKKPKRNFRPRTRDSISHQLMDETVKELSVQLRNLEIKIAIEQFMMNQTIDHLQRKGILTEQESKSIYSDTFRFWKEDMKGKGDPFRDIDLDTLPVLESYRKKLRNREPILVEGIQGANPSDRPSESYNSVYQSSEKGELTGVIKQMKEEMKGLKKELLKQKVEDLKQFLP